MAEIKYIWKPAKAYKLGRVHPIQSIILHSSDGHLEGDLATLTGPKVSAHWYVSKNGDVYHLVDNHNTAYHAGVVYDPKYSNAASIGIEQEHIDEEEEWPMEQVQSAANLIEALSQKYGVLQVKSHAEVAFPAGRKVDPVDYPWKKSQDFVAQASLQKWTFSQK